MTLALVLLIVSPVVQLCFSQTTTSDGCYKRYADSKVNCLQSFMSKNVFDEQDCTQLCTQNAPKCKACQVTPGTNQCDLYDTALPVSKTGRRKRAAACYGYGPAVYYGAGFCYYVPSGQCGGYGGLSSTAAPATPPTVPPTPPTMAPSPSTTTTMDPPTTTTTVAPTTQPAATTTVQIPDGASCPSGKVARYTMVEGVQIGIPADATFQVTDEQACIKACTDNRQPTGTAAPCRSFDYNSDTKQCAVSMQQTPPAGNAPPQPNPASKHYEKVCVDATIANKCPGPYYRAPQMILVGFAQAVTTATDTADCLQICANSQARFNFACSSGMFYFTEKTNNCILNSETRTTHPDLFTSETNDGVEYFEPGCTVTRARRQAPTSSGARNRNVLQLNQPSYGAWTMCDVKLQTHERFKQCKSYDPNTCQIDTHSCDPTKENEYDLDIDTSISANATLEQNKKAKATTIKVVGTTPKSTPGPISTSKPTSTSAPKTNPTSSTSKPTSTSTAKTTPKAPPQTTSVPAKSTQTATTSRPNSPCAPFVKQNGRIDCNRGDRAIGRGQRETCVPTQRECNDAMNAANKGSQRQRQ